MEPQPPPLSSNLKPTVLALLGATLLSASCVTPSPGPGHSGVLKQSASSPQVEQGPSTPTVQAPPHAPEPGPVQPLRRGSFARGLGGRGLLLSAAVPRPSELSCGGRKVSAHWPDFGARDSHKLLEPLLECLPGEFVAVQERADMPRVVREMDDWDAVLLSALGPIREDAAPTLNRKRAAFLIFAAEQYGPLHAQVLALFLFDSAHDDEVDAVLRLLAADKRLWETLQLMPWVQATLETRGFNLSKYQDRPEQAGDILRGLGRTVRDGLATSPMVGGGRYLDYSSKVMQLPAAYQLAFFQLEQALALEHFSPGNVVLGSVDSATFGVPLGLYHLVVGTGQGLVSLRQGQWELATRQLAPAALLVTGYAGGKVVGAMRGLSAAQLSSRLLEVARSLEARLGVEGLGEVARYMRARREAGRFVAVGGADAAEALVEARGNVAHAQAWLSRAQREHGGSSTARGKASSAPERMASAAEGVRAPNRPAPLAALVDESTGLTREVVESKLALVEGEAQGSRLSKDVALLEQQRPTVEAPPPTGRGHPLWSEYVAYYEKRLAELKQGKTDKGPLRWEAYEEMRGLFARGLAFERLMVEVLRADAALPRELRRFLGGFIQPRIEMYVGVWKPKSSLRFADVLVIEESPLAGQPPRVETFSFKSRDFSSLKGKELNAQMSADASEARGYYGETVDIRRPSLKPLLSKGTQVPVQKVHLIYEGGSLKPETVNVQRAAVSAVQNKIPEVEVQFE